MDYNSRVKARDSTLSLNQPNCLVLPSGAVILQVSYCDKTKLALNEKINPSLFEGNP